MVDKPTVSEPPKGRGIYIKPCDHNYEFLRSDFESSEGSYRDHYEQKDIFFCRKCLHYEVKLVRSETLRGRPSWFKG